jgi:hypothetical protein
VHEDPPRPVAPGWLAPLFEATMTDEESRWDARQVREFLTAGATAVAPAVSRRARRSARPPAAPPVAAGTQVLQAVRPGDDVGPAGGRGAEDPEAPRRNRLVWVLVAVAVLAVVLVSVVLTRVLGDSSDPVADAPVSTPSATSEVSPSATPPAAPTAEGMESFIRQYLATAPTNQETSFQELTPEFQAASPDYRSFWGSVSDIDVSSITADPANLTVTYVYSYRRDGKRVRDERVSLQLAFSDGRYAIAGES